jgi:hypothetical protein
MSKGRLIGYNFRLSVTSRDHIEALAGRRPPCRLGGGRIIVEVVIRRRSALGKTWHGRISKADGSVTVGSPTMEAGGSI